MKKIEAIIKSSKIREIKKALSEVGVNKITVTEVKEFGHHNDHVAIYRGNEHLVDFLPHIKLEAVVTDQQLDQAVDAIAESAKTEKDGAGEILVFTIERAVRIGAKSPNAMATFSRS
jgi:nitrogen regulatory protein PII